jgi:CRISPR-associated endonuclease/helicase Cas3
VVNRVDAARRIFDNIAQHLRSTIKDVELVLLTGRVRPLDRERIIERLKDLKLFADPDRRDPEKPVILVATQTIEAGADLDFDALVTEIAPLDCLRQRFGRLDRLGKRGESRAVILHPKGKPGKHNDWAPIGRIYGDSAYETKEWIAGIEGEIEFGIDAFAPKLRELEGDPDKLQKLLSPRADAPVLLPAYADLWATTSPAPVATPKPELFLHGPRIDRDVQIVWRADIDLNDTAAANVSLDFCPPASLEALSLPVWAAQRWLSAMQDAQFADVTERTPEEVEIGGERSCLCYDSNRPERKRWAKVEGGAVKPGDRIVVPCTFGGCDEWGWNPQSKNEVVDLGAEAHYLQRLKGVLRVAGATLGNALRSEGREDETDAIWDEIKRAMPEEGEEWDAADAIALLLERRDVLPRTWRALIEGHYRKKGIKDRRTNVASFGNNDWSRGCLLYAEKMLDTGLLDGATEDEPDGGEAITDRDDSSRIGEKVVLIQHLRHVEGKARAYAKAAGLDDRLVDLVALAARLHDIGKAEPRFQADLYGRSALVRWGLSELGGQELLAKSARGEGRRGSVRAVPENFRHEALSVALAERHPAIMTLSDNDRDLILWLIGTHHGYGRPFFPPMTDDAANTEVTVPDGILGAALRARAGDVPLRLDQGWFERAGRVIRRFGSWELARLEAILRLADHAVSAEEQAGSVLPPKGAEKAEAVS